jgi:hypothetical protein
MAATRGLGPGRVGASRRHVVCVVCSCVYSRGNGVRKCCGWIREVVVLAVVRLIEMFLLKRNTHAWKGNIIVNDNLELFNTH